MIVSVPATAALVAFIVGCMVVTLFCVSRHADNLNAKYSLQNDITFYASKLKSMRLELECSKAAGHSLEAQRDTLQVVRDSLAEERDDYREKWAAERATNCSNSTEFGRVEWALKDVGRERDQARTDLEWLQAKLRYLADSTPDGIVEK